MKTFAGLVPPLCAESLALLAAQGFVAATPVQAATIPLLCSNKDVAVEAVTGSGKTLAFVLPAVEILRRIDPPLTKYQVGALLIAPTRELAAQLGEVAAPFFAAALPLLRCQVLTGGHSVSADRLSLAQHGANILVGTPGRLHDILSAADCPLSLRSLEVVILDEADRLLDMGFQTRLTSLLELLPRQRRTGLFSATQSREVLDLARAGLRNPVRVQVRTTATAPPAPATGTAARKGAGGAVVPPGTNGVSSAGLSAAHQKLAAGQAVRVPSSLTLQALVCPAREKSAHMVRWLAAHTHVKAMVFVMTCACVEYWDAVLRMLPGLRGINFVPLHGKMKQSKRDVNLDKFRKAPTGVLLCTDVAARGLDFPDIDSILQFDPPQDPKAFLHRAGRTARMGREGSAMVLLTPEEDAYVQFLRLQGAPVELVETTGAPQGGPEEGQASDPGTESLERNGKAASTAEEVISQVRAAARRDRAVVEKGARAFVSFFRGYKEHHCNFIFRWKDLDWGSVAMGYGLLQVPSVPELKRRPQLAASFEAPEETVDISTIKYRDRAREKERLKAIKEREAAEAEHGHPAHRRNGTGPRSNTQEGPGSKGRLGGAGEAGGGGRGGGRGARGRGGGRKADVRPLGLRAARRQREQAEAEDFAAEYRMLRKAKKGRVSEAALDKALGVDLEEGGVDKGSGSEGE